MHINLHPVDAVLIRLFPQEYYLSSFGYNTKLPVTPGVGGLGVGGHIQEVMLPTPTSASHPVCAGRVLSFRMPRCCCTIISGQRWYAGAGTAHGPPPLGKQLCSHGSLSCAGRPWRL